MANRLAWMGGLLVVAGVAAALPARAEDDDVLVVPVDPEGSGVVESAALAGDVRSALVRRGVGVLAHPESRLEHLAPSVPVADPDLREVGNLVRAMWFSRDAKKPTEIADLALRLYPLLRELRTADFGAEYVASVGRSRTVTTRLADAYVGACLVDGVEALSLLGRLGEGGALIEMCADHPWMMDVLPPALRPVYEPLLHAAELRVKTVPSGLLVRVAGSKMAETRDGVWAVRVRDGGRFPVEVSCPQLRERRRVHWVDVAPGARTLTVEVDCELDAATHADANGLWLSSSVYALADHARALGRLVSAGRVVTVERDIGRFRLQLRGLGGSDKERAVTLPIGYSSRQLERAVDGLFTVAQAQSAAPEAAPAAPPRAVVAASSAMLWQVWSGAALLVVGAGLDVAAWSVERHRARRGESLAQSLEQSEEARQRWWELRVPMYGLASSAAVGGSAGAMLLAVGLSENALPLWSTWASAGVGAGLAAWGVVDVSRGARCNDVDARACASNASVRDRGGLAIATAVPFLTLAVTKWLRRATRSDAAAVTVGAAPQRVIVSGRW
jgi:hypothetical protein